MTAIACRHRITYCVFLN